MQSYAVAEAKAESYREARKLFKRVTTVQPDSAPSWHAWAKMELTVGDTPLARELYIRALNLKPRNVATLSALGHLERTCASSTSLAFTSSPCTVK